MKISKESVAAYLESLRGDAKNLLAATSGIAEDRVKEARQRLTHALDDGVDICDRVRAQALRGARAADESVRENPYAPIAVALILGGLLGFLLTRPRE